MREPGVAWWPGRIAAGSRTDALAATHDIFPTVLALAAPPPPGLVIDGVNLSMGALLRRHNRARLHPHLQ